MLAELFSFSQFNWDFCVGFFSIIFINIILSGDNAVLIAMAVKTLPKKQRAIGIAFGAGAAVVLRIAFTFFAAQLLEVSFVKLVGGLFILWIAVTLFSEGGADEDSQKEAGSLKQAIWIIIIADLTMSLDNILAIAGACKGSLLLLIIGLGLSIPLVVFASNILATLMDRYKFIVYIGAAVLGRVGGEMIITDPYVQKLLHPSLWLEYSVQIICICAVLGAGRVWMNYKRAQKKVESKESVILN